MADKSAIQECRDQLFLDRADGIYLSNLTANLGFDRPQFGFSDDAIWRAIVRRCANDYRQIANVFRDILTIWFGPKNTVATVLAADASAGDTQITLQDATRIPQRGTLVIDEGLINEETITYTFRDPKTGAVDLATALTYAHVYPNQNYTNYLMEDEAATTTVLQLEETQFFPGSGVLLIDAGGADEETKNFSSNDTSLKQLTLTAGLTNDQIGPKASPICTALDSFQASQQVVFVTDSSKFPEEGLILVQEDNTAGTPSQIVRFLDNNTTSNILTLAEKLTGSYTTATVTLLNPGASITLAQVQVKGIGWEIFETDQNVLKIYLPTNITENRLIDASYLHDVITTLGGPPTLDGAANIGDTSITVSDASNFPDGGAISINSGAETIGYGRIDRFEARLNGDYVATNTSIFVDQVKHYIDAQDLTKELIIGYGTGSEEVVAWSSINEVTNEITLAAGLTNGHSSAALVKLNSPEVIHLSRALTSAHSSGVTVEMFEDAYSGTDLAIGDPTVATATSEKRFQGPYLYSPTDRAPRNVRTTLAESLAGPTTLIQTQRPGYTALEVDDATLFETSGVFGVKVHKGVSNGETLDVTGIQTRRGMTGITINSVVSVDDTIITLSSTASPFPNAKGFRIIIDRGNANEEVLWVEEVLTGTTISTTPATKTHAVSDTVEILADIIILSEAVIYEHTGKVLWDQRLNLLFTEFSADEQINVVEELRSYITVTSAASLTANGGYVILNFAKEKNLVESRLTADSASGVGTLTVEDASLFPTTYNYYVIVGPGAGRTVAGDFGTEILKVTGIAGNVITFDGNTRFAHMKNEWIQYVPGDEEILSYSSTTTGGPERLNFSTPIALENQHNILENVVLSDSLSTPNDEGTDYPFYLPSSWEERLEWLFDKVRAAGVQVIVINDR
jgi:hypothetical protein